MDTLDNMTTQQIEELTVARLVELCEETGTSVPDLMGQVVARIQTGEHDR